MMTMSEACIQHYQQLSTIWINSAVENEKYYDKFDIRQYSAMQLLGACAGVYEVTEFKKTGLARHSNTEDEKRTTKPLGQQTVYKLTHY